MPALRPDALAGLTVDVGSEELCSVLRGLGAAIVDHSASTVDVTVIDLRRPALTGEWLDDVAQAGAAAFAGLQQAYARRCPTVLCVLPATDADAEATLAAAVGSLARSVAVEWARDGVRVNCVVAAPDAPGLADVVGYLVSPAAAMLTGAIVEVGRD